MPAALLVGCGGGDAQPGAGGSTAGSGASGGFVSSGGGGGVQSRPPLYASFVVETQVGEAPARIRFQNDSAAVLSLWVSDAFFEAVPASSASEPQLAASDDLENDSQVGIHEGDQCFTYRFKSLLGAEVLTPGHRYVLSATAHPVEGMDGLVTDEGQDPVAFIGLRARLVDPGPIGVTPTRLRVGPLGADEPHVFQTYDAAPTSYVLAGQGSALISTLEFSSSSGAKYAASSSLTLTGADGYTVWVDAQPVPGAAEVIELGALD